MHQGRDVTERVSASFLHRSGRGKTVVKAGGPHPGESPVPGVGQEQSAVTCPSTGRCHADTCRAGTFTKGQTVGEQISEPGVPSSPVHGAQQAAMLWESGQKGASYGPQRARILSGKRDSPHVWHPNACVSVRFRFSFLILHSSKC